MARSLESQFPGTPAPPNIAYGQQVPSISFTGQAPGGYPVANQPGGMQNMQPGYQAQAYSQGEPSHFPKYAILMPPQ